MTCIPNKKTFRDIAVQPFITKEQAIDIYKKVKDGKVVYETNGNQYSSLKDALLNNNSSNVSLKVLSDEPQTILTIKDFNSKSINGFILNAIKNNLLEETRNKDFSLVVNGKTQSEKTVNKERLYEFAVEHGFELSFDENAVDIKEKLPQKDTFIKEKLETDVLNTMLVNKRGDVAKLNESQKQLALQLLSLLNDIGVSTLSISEYVRKYKLKNGVEPNAKALADIANKVIALKDGKITLEDLTEEVAHFIIEGTDDIDNVLDYVVNTPEYLKYAEKYRKIYDDEEAVRREVLGKILATAIQDKFVSKEEMRQNLYDKIKEFINKFLEKLNIKVDDKNKLDTIIEKLSTDFADGTLELNEQNFVDNRFKLYSVGDNAEIRNKTLTAIRILQSQMAQLNRGNKGLAIDKTKLKQLFDKHEKEEYKLAINGIIELTDKQVKYIEKALETADDGFLTLEEKNVFYSITQRLRPVIEGIKGYVKKNSNDKDYRILDKKIDDLSLKITNLSSQISENKQKAIDDLVETMMIRHNFPESYRDTVYKYIESIDKDTNTFFLYIGQLMHSHDPILNLAGNVISDTHKDARLKFIRRTKELLNIIEESGVSHKDLRKLFDNGYLVDEIDHKAFETAVLNIELEEYNKIKGLEIDLKEYKKRKRSRTLDLSRTEQLAFNKEKNKRVLKLVEKPFTEEYYKQKWEKYEKLDIHNETIDFINGLSADRARIYQKAVNSDGTLDYTKLDETSLFQLQEMKTRRAKAKNIYDDEGLLKKGFVFAGDGNYIEVNGVKYYLEDNASLEARLSFDLHRLDADFKRTEIGISKFLEHFKKAENKLAFLKLNATIGFSDDFWDNFTEPITKRLMDIGEDVLASEIKDIQTRLKAIIRPYANINNISEINANDMTVGEQKAVKDLQEQLKDYMISAYSVLNMEEKEQVSEVTVNEAYKKAVEDLNDDEKVEFIKQHVIDRDKRTIDELIYLYKSVVANRPIFVKKKIQRILDKYGYDSIEQVDTNEIYSNIIIPYAESRLLPYYTKFSPIGYDAVMNDLNTGNLSAEEFMDNYLNGKYSFLKVTPNYSYAEDTDETYMNKNYNPDYEGGYLQPKKSLFTSKKYNELFGGGRNKGLLKAYNALKEYHAESLRAINEYKSHSLFKLPQISKHTLEKAFGLVKGGDIKGKISEIIKDFSMYRVDDLEYGEEFGGDIQKDRVIPKYFIRDLENENDVSSELLYSFTMFAQQADLHEARQKNIGNMLMLRDVIINRKMNGKVASASNIAKQFDSYMDYNFYGVKEAVKFEVNILGRKLDITKAFRGLSNRFIKKVMAGNVIVAGTSYITAEVTSLIERMVGEHIHHDAMKKATTEWRKISGDAIGEMGKIHSKARLNVIGEAMGIYKLSERFENTNYGYLTRNITRVGNAVHEMGNFPIIPRVELAVLFDYRIVGDEIMNYNQYKRKMLAEGKTIDYIKKEWKTYENDVFYNFIKTDNGIFSIDYDAISEKTGKGKEYIDNKFYGIVDLARNVIKNVDGQLSQEEKALLHRNFLFSFMTTFRNWLYNALQRKFKSRHFNTATGEMEEGHYVTAYKMFGEFIKNMQENDWKGWSKQMREMWYSADDFQKRNLWRTAYEAMMLNTLAIIGYILSNLADDDRDDYLLQLANYMFARLVNETASQQGIGMANEFASMVETPIVSWNYVKDATVGLENFFDGEIIKSGKYRGMTKRERQALKVIPYLKVGFDLSTPRESYNTYHLYNKFNLEPNVLFRMLVEE